MRRNTNKNLNGFISNARVGVTRFNYSGIITNNQNYLNGLETNMWEPPSDWLQLPRLERGDQRFVGLYAILPGASGNTGACADSNFVALRCAGNYIVDWGNGVTSAHASNTTAQYQYNFASIPDSTLTTEGYKQVIIQAYPQSGANLTTVNLAQLYSAPGVTLTSAYVTGWLDLRIVGRNISSLNINANPVNISHSMLKRFEFVGPSSLTNINYCFWNLSNLQKLLGQEFTSNCTSAVRMVAACNSLTYLDLLDTRGITGDQNRPFEGCTTLKTIPPLHFSKVTSFLGAFRSCINLKNIPMLDTSNVTTFSIAFELCLSLRRIPEFDTSKVTTFERAFENCVSLEELPPLDTSNGTNFAGFLNNTFNLKVLPNLNFSKGEVFSTAFLRSRIFECPPLNVPNAKNFDSAFVECRNLYKVHGITFGGLTTAQNLFRDCPVLVEIGPINFSSLTAGSTLSTTGPLLNAFHTGAGTLNTISPLSSLKLYGVQKSINISNKLLCAANLNDIFTNLVNVTGTGATITITNNWGVAGCSTGIATSKGWTVVS